MAPVAAGLFHGDIDDKTLYNFVVVEGNGVKGMVDSGLLSEVPNLFIQPQHERIQFVTAVKNKEVKTTKHLPIIDLSELDDPTKHEEVVRKLVDAAESLGFFQIMNHGVPSELLERLKQAAHNFFNQPPEYKSLYLRGRVSPSSPIVKYGTSFAPEKAGKALEWKDFVSMIYTSDSDALQFWPQECKEAALEYLKTSSKMVRRILEVLFGNLGLEVIDKNEEYLYMGGMRVNMNFYPPCPDPELTVGVAPHSDMGTLTVLLQDGIGGLHVKINEDEQEESDGEWIEIPPIPSALVINVGDSLQILSNGRYKSAEHRVRTTSTQSRVSIPLFVAPRPGDKIGPLPQVVENGGIPHYRDFLCAEYMNNFFGKAHEGKKSLDFAKISP
ncbi:Oxoglutarate/iron-dependent dioxygenase [Macleaya cordata]|uniref:Oxoglutarate/iron-dependent dioxygenase n=1 Tax=Macleaya cordata TaxID=56857 RepID=A0A200Q330_MACCD|nr:Oxoglutarate/iron-dependent dioxygenase [Macleaya cordata]